MPRSRSKPFARYIVAVSVAVVLVITLYNLQTPHELIQSISNSPPPPPLDFEFDDELPSGAPLPSTIPDVPHAPSYPPHTSSQTWRERAEKVKAAFRHAYDGYRQHATGFDELRPQSKGAVNK